jgi:hypothetical protein
VTFETVVILWGISSIAAVAGSWASLRQRMIDKEKRDNERLERIEKSVGISNGDGAAFVRVGLCKEVHGATQRDLESVKQRVEHAIERGEVAIEEGRKDRELLKERIDTIRAEGATDRANLREMVANYIQESRDDRITLTQRTAMIEGKVQAIFARRPLAHGFEDLATEGGK